MTMPYLNNVSAFFLLFIFINGVSGLSTMEDSHSVGAPYLTKEGVKSSYKIPNLLGFSEKIGQACSKEDIVVNQGATSPQPNGIPTYTVEILNVCRTGCSIAEIHLTCGWFSSEAAIDPKLFKRLSYNDCLVNNGDPIKAGDSVSFVYAQKSKYPMAVSSVKCVP
ncbi:TPD1 protein homolog 1-like isoform X1 [Cryptomeria japonica]|uniref:TPD1 protein homolog 1-like isoform X1 n=1 Tax=Cryptomeria japonica TaxID=3369 RepID=UPI0025ACCD41|nr:TPD1 protein homolog 1-like isoform X1 [Cryptomeria japonica]